MKRLLLLLISLIGTMSVSLQAQQITLSGRVTDAQTRETLQGANIYLQKLKKGVTSDAQGCFKIALPQGERIRMTVSYVGYQSQDLHLQLTTDTLLNISLTHDNRLEEVDVYADRQHFGIEHSQMSANFFIHNSIVSIVQFR